MTPIQTLSWIGVFSFRCFMESKEIHKLIPKIMSEVGSIGKNRRGKNIDYAFRGIDDVYLSLQGPLSKHGVYFVPEIISNNREERQSKSGSTLTIAIITIKFTFYAGDGSSVHAITVGEAMDTSDKASNKAMSAALKAAAFQIFCIPTEDESDTEYQNHEPVPRAKSQPQNATRPSEAQLKRLYAMSKAYNWSETDVKDYLRQLGIESSKELNIMQYDSLCEKMEKFPKRVSQ